MKNKSSKKQLKSLSQNEKGQKKITNFFNKATSANNTGNSSNQNGPSVDNQNPEIGLILEAETKEVEVIQIIDPKQKEHFIITLSDSDEETPAEQPHVHGSTVSTCTSTSTSNYFQGTASDNAVACPVSQPNDVEVENMEPEASFEDSDSDDEILSQLDIEEIISSQEKLSQQCALEQSSQDQTLSLPRIINQTPTKSPKAKVNYYSPLSRLRSHSPLKGKSSSDSSKSSTSSRKSRAFTPGTADVAGEKVSKRPVVRKLSFDPPVPFVPFVPYYLQNFEAVVNSSIDDPFNAHLFDEFDVATVKAFGNLSFEARCLYTRLYPRKWEWKVAANIKYEQINKDLSSAFSELHSVGFIVEIQDVQEEVELESLLDILSAEQMLALGKQMNVSSEKKTKKSIKEALLKLAKSKTCSKFGSVSQPGEMVRKRVLSLLGLTYMLEGGRRALFSRLFVLHSPPQYWEDEQEQATNQLLKIWMADVGRMLYPIYRVKKTTVIYRNRDDLLSFHDAWSLHCEITAHIESKNWDEVIGIGQRSIDKLQLILSDQETIDADQSLPTFLRVYKAGSVLTRVSWLAVEGHQKLKQYKEANRLIKLLLEQLIYLPHYRGRWFDRFVINQKQLKARPDERKETLQTALEDSFLLYSHRLNLSDRLDKVLEEIKRKEKPPPRKKMKKSNADNNELFNASEPAVSLNETEPTGLFRLKNDEVPTRIFEGEKLFNPNMGKSVFLGKQDDNGTSQTSSVEHFAIACYKQSGYKYGIHAEGAVISAIFGLLFWDEIYSDEISDAFHSQYQIMPLDLHFEDFYSKRSSILQDKLTGMRSSWTIDDALTLLETNWKEHYDVLSIVNWTVFADLEQAKSLLKTMGLGLAADICERLAKNYRHFRSGFPDLVLWNDTDLIFVEVKGPGDSLSDKQRIWLDFLLSLNAKAEVCRVKSVSNKRIKT